MVLRPSVNCLGAFSYLGLSGTTHDNRIPGVMPFNTCVVSADLISDYLDLEYVRSQVLPIVATQRCVSITASSCIATRLTPQKRGKEIGTRWRLNK